MEKIKKYADNALMIVQSLAILAIIGGLCYLLFKGYSFATNSAINTLTGTSSDTSAVALYSWLAIGVICTWVWPIKYRENMRGEDWASVVKGTPLYMFAGPLALLLSYPL